MRILYTKEGLAVYKPGMPMLRTFEEYLNEVTEQVAEYGVQAISAVGYPHKLLLGFKSVRGEYLVQASQIKGAATRYALKRRGSALPSPLSSEVLTAFFNAKMAEAISEGRKRQMARMCEGMLEDPSRAPDIETSGEEEAL